MKIFLLLFALMPLSLYSQITITDADMPSPGSKYINTSALADLTIDLNATGENFLWDYSDQIPLYSLGDTFIDSDDLPLIFLLFFFNSSLADKSGVNVSLDQFTIEDVYTVYKKTTSQYQIDGFGGTIDGLSLPVVYSSKDVLYRFPMNFGNTDSCDASIVLDIPGLAYFSQQRHRVNSIDGWGTINTPSGSYDALRVKSTITDIDSVFLDTLSFGYSTSLKSIEYKWLAKESGIPVFQINAQDVLGYQVVSQIIYQDTAFETGIEELINKENEVVVFPNPSSQQITIDFGDEKASFCIYSSLGAIITNELAASISFQIDVSSWSSGLYFLKVITVDKTSFQTFLINH